FFFSSRRRHKRSKRDWSSDVCSSDLQIKDTTFVYDENIQTPMAYGVISFKDEADAEKYVEEEGLGEILNPEELEEHEWKMNKEMMEKNKEMMDMDEGDHNHDEK